MEIEQLRSQWNEMDQRVLALEAKTRRRVDGEAIFNVATSVLTLGVVGNFLGDHLMTFGQNPQWAVPAVLVMLLAVSTMVMAVVPYGIARWTPLDADVAGVQRQLIAYRKLHVWLMRFWVAVLVPGWMVFPMLGFQLLLGPRVISGTNPAWFWGNVVFGQLFLVGMWFVPAVRRWFADVSSGREQLRRLGLEAGDWA
jgi:hypothetical protein